jgi:hypothetical protein
VFTRSSQYLVASPFFNRMIHLPPRLFASSYGTAPTKTRHKIRACGLASRDQSVHQKENWADL